VGGFFQVDLDVLQQVTRTLGAAGEQMDAALKAMSASRAGRIGTDALDGAADHFERTWHYGLSRLIQMIHEADEGVAGAHDAYTRVEADVGEAMSEINRGIMREVGSAVAAAAARGGRPAR
jgi:hypothetical protein